MQDNVEWWSYPNRMESDGTAEQWNRKQSARRATQQTVLLTAAADATLTEKDTDTLQRRQQVMPAPSPGRIMMS